jgi:hypothetical protein
LNFAFHLRSLNSLAHFSWLDWKMIPSCKFMLLLNDLHCPLQCTIVSHICLVYVILERVPFQIVPGPTGGLRCGIGLGRGCGLSDGGFNHHYHYNPRRQVSLPKSFSVFRPEQSLL